MAVPWVGGVCSGIAHYFRISVLPVRAVAVALTAMGGIGFFVYMTLWILVPTESPTSTGTKDDPYRSPLKNVGRNRSSESIAGQLFVIGSVFLSVALLILVVSTISQINWRVVLWITLIIAGLFLTWMQAPKLTSTRTWRVVSAMVLGVGLVVVGAFLLMGEYGLLRNLGFGAMVGGVTVVAIAVALIPLGIRMVRDLATSRANEARETERAEIGAHIHDSVLQTLTLIRGAADDPARVRALALTQERELRSWLYTGHTTPEVSIAQALTNQASAVETTYGIAIEVVTVGDAKPSAAELAAIAAAAEAMTNAARHGAPPITVFQEVRPRTLEIFVKDAGPGFDPSDIPSHRHGFRNSIKGRVERVGGTVFVRTLYTEVRIGDEDRVRQPVPASGTEIHIAVPRDPRKSADSVGKLDEAVRLDEIGGLTWQSES